MRDKTSNNAVRPYWIKVSLDFGGFGFPEHASGHFSYVLKPEPKSSRSCDFVDEWMSEIPVRPDKMKEIQDFSYGPFGSIVISEAVRDALPRSVSENSRFIACREPGSDSPKFFVWILDMRGAFLIPCDPLAEKLMWNHDALDGSSVPLARDSRFSTRHIAISRDCAEYDFVEQYKSMGWRGLEFHEQPNRPRIQT